MMFFKIKRVAVSAALVSMMAVMAPAVAQIDATPLDSPPPGVPSAVPEVAQEQDQERLQGDTQGPVRIIPQGVLSGVGVGPMTTPTTPTTPTMPSGPVTPPVQVQDPFQAPFDGASGLPGEPVVQAPPPLVETVTTVRLEPLDPSSAGLLTRDDGGFPRNIWAGTSREAIAAVLPKLPVNVTSPTMNALAQRLLLTAADVPARQTEGLAGAIEEDEYDLMRARVERLATGGELPSLVALLEQLPPEIDDEVLTRTRVDAYLLSGNLNDACNEASTANERADDPYWFQVVAFCRVVEGNPAGADFATDMLRDMGVNDPAFFAMMARLSQPVALMHLNPRSARWAHPPL